MRARIRIELSIRQVLRQEGEHAQFSRLSVSSTDRNDSSNGPVILRVIERISINRDKRAATLDCKFRFSVYFFPYALDTAEGRTEVRIFNATFNCTQRYCILLCGVLECHSIRRNVICKMEYQALLRNMQKEKFSVFRMQLRHGYAKTVKRAQ